MTGIEEVAALGGTAAASSAAAGTAAAGAAAATTAAAAGTAAAAAGGLGATLAAAAPYIAVGSSLLSAVGSIAGGQQQKSALETAAATQRTNAGSALNSSEADAARLQDRARRSAATASNQTGGAGIDISSGSPLDVMADTAAQGALDTEIARWRGVSQANAYLTSGAQSSAQADQAGTTGYINAGTTLLTAGARYATSRTGSRAGAGAGMS